MLIKLIRALHHCITPLITTLSRITAGKRCKNASDENTARESTQPLKVSVKNTKMNKMYPHGYGLRVRRSKNPNNVANYGGEVAEGWGVRGGGEGVGDRGRREG